MTIDKQRRRTAYSRPHWSYSQLTQYMRCPLQYYFERIAGLPRAYSPSSLAFGSAIHEALAMYHRQMQHRTVPSTAAVQEAFLIAWEEQESYRPIQFKGNETRDATLEQGAALLQTYLAEPPPQEIVAVEQPLVVPLITSAGEILSRPLVAIVDLLHRQEAKLTVTEFKTSSRKYGDLEVDTTLQATCYAHAVKERYDEEPDIEYMVLVKTKQAQVQRINTVRNEQDCSRLGDIVQQIEQAIDAKVFFPNESPLNCSGCPYRSACRSWKGTPNIKPESAVTVGDGKPYDAPFASR